MLEVLQLVDSGEVGCTIWQFNNIRVVRLGTMLDWLPNQRWYMYLERVGSFEYSVVARSSRQFEVGRISAVLEHIESPLP